MGCTVRDPQPASWVLPARLHGCLGARACALPSRGGAGQGQPLTLVLTDVEGRAEL